MKTHPPLSVCFELAWYLVPRDVLLPVHNIVARTEHCVQRTLPVRTVFFWDIIIRWTWGGGVLIKTVEIVEPEGEKQERGVLLMIVFNTKVQFLEGWG